MIRLILINIDRNNLYRSLRCVILFLKIFRASNPNRGTTDSQRRFWDLCFQRFLARISLKSSIFPVSIDSRNRSSSRFSYLHSKTTDDVDFVENPGRAQGDRQTDRQTDLDTALNCLIDPLEHTCTRGFRLEFERSKCRVAPEDRLSKRHETLWSTREQGAKASVSQIAELTIPKEDDEVQQQ